MAELWWIRMCYDLMISQWRRQILCLAWITFAVRDTYQPPEPLNSCRPELKPEHPVSAVSLSPRLPPSITLFPLSTFPLPPPHFLSCCLKVILKAFWSLSRVKGDKIKCLKVWFLRQLWLHSVLQPDLYMTAPLHPLGISAEEVGWLLCLVEGDLVCCRVNGFPFRRGVCPNCCPFLLDCSGISPRLGRGEGGDTKVWCCSFSSNQFTAGATASRPLRSKRCGLSVSGPAKTHDVIEGNRLPQ